MTVFDREYHMHLLDDSRAFARWGPFLFHRIDSIPVEKFQWNINYRLAPQPILGGPQKYHWTGAGEEKIIVEGLIAPASSVGKPKSVYKLREYADQGTPFLLTLKPQDLILGMFFIEQIHFENSDLIGSLGYKVQVKIHFKKQPEGF